MSSWSAGTACPSEPYRRARDTLRFLRAALSGEKVTAAYDTFEVKGFRLTVGEPPDPPVPLLLAALRPQMLRLAAREADGAIINWLSPDDAVRVTGIVRDIAPDAEIVARLFVCPNPDRAAVLPAAKRMLAGYVSVAVYRAFQVWLGRGAMLAPFWERWDSGDRAGALKQIPDELVDDIIINGTPAACRAQIARYVANGVTTRRCTCCPSATWTPTRATACSVPPQGTDEPEAAIIPTLAARPAPQRIMNVGIVWFRRDLRLADNPAWAAATATCDRVIAAFVVDPQLWDRCHERRRAMLAGNLRSLDGALAARGGRLWVGRGEPVETLAELIRQTGARAVFANRDASPYAARRDETASARLPMRWTDGCFVHAPGSVRSRTGTGYTVFTPYFRAWSALPPEPWPGSGSAEVAADPGTGVPAADVPPLETGEEAAERRLDAFADRVDRYAEERDRPDLESTSKLSVDLKWGTISPRRVVDALAGESPGRAAFVRQVAWRDFWAQIMAARPRPSPRRCGRSTGRSAGVRTRTGSRPGSKDGPATRSWTPGCASCAPRGGSTTGCAWWWPRSW